MTEDNPTAQKVGTYIGNVIFWLVVILIAVAFLVFICALIGALGAFVAESYVWFREALHWV